MKQIQLLIFTLGLVAILTGCGASKSQQSVQYIVAEPVRTAPGVVEYVWEEPMVDVIEVPPGLDPDGIYYRPAHQAIVEIRQGRWKYYNQKK